MYTVFTKPDEARVDWYVVDAAGKTLGRLASQIAHRLKGKHKPNYAPHQDLGDHIVVINAGTVRVTGAKLTDKFYHQHTGYVGNLKSIALGKLLQEHPERAIEFAIKGMLPKGPLGRRMYRKLHVFGGSEHPHQAQQPKALGNLRVRRKPINGKHSQNQFFLWYRTSQDVERAGLSS
jgi:large subunit ribosomal protein L13